MRYSDIIADLSRRAGTLMLALAMLLCCAPALADEDDAEECAPPFALLTLVNRWNSLDPECEPVLADIGDGHEIDARAALDFERMMNACRTAGLRPVVRSSYRTWNKQTSLYENKVRRVRRAGTPAHLARMEAATVVAYPGTSEHQLGLALDIVDRDYQALDTEQENTPVQKWLMENSWKYGFILRYPSDKCARTGIIYEPWHYRYVGMAVAREIYESGLCFEEYVYEHFAPELGQVPLELHNLCHIYVPISSRF